MNLHIVNTVSLLLVMIFSSSAYSQHALNRSDELAVRLTLMKYCTELTNFGYSHDSEEYDQLIELFEHRDVEIFDDLDKGGTNTSIYNYLTTIDRQRPPGHQITFQYDPSPKNADIQVIKKKTGKEAQIVLKKSISGGTKGLQTTATNVIYISLEDYKITGIFGTVPRIDLEEPQTLPEPISDASILVKNSCGSDINLAIVYQDNNNVWQSLGVWTIRSDNQSYLNQAQGKLLKTSGGELYFYAETVDKTLEWKGEHIKYFRGDKYEMKKITMKVRNNNEYEFGLSCGTPSNQK